MDIVNKPNSDDITLEDDGVKVFLEKEAERILADATLNYSDEGGFEITGLQGSSCCG